MCIFARCTHTRIFGFISDVLRNIFSGGGALQIHLRTDARFYGDLVALAPSSGVPLYFQMGKKPILIRL
jgi:hypothetical protein